MAGLIPINRVFIQYNPTTAARVSFQYYGCMLGVAKELHDLTSKGFFEPADDGSDTDLDLDLKGYIKRECQVTIKAANLDTGANLGFVIVAPYTVTIPNSTGRVVSYTVNVAYAGTYTPQDVLLELETKIAAEVNPSILAVYDTSVLYLTTTNVAYNTNLVSDAAYSGLDHALIAVTDYEISPSAYPNIKSGSVIDPYKVKIWSKNTKLFANKTFASNLDTQYRLVPIKPNIAALGKRDGSAKTLMTPTAATATLATTFGGVPTTRSWRLNNKMIEPGSVWVSITSTGGTLTLTDIPLVGSVANITGEMKGGLYIYTTTNIEVQDTGVTPLAIGDMLTSSYVDYAAGYIYLSEILRDTTGPGTSVASFAASVMPLTQITKSSSGFTALKDLKAQDTISMGAFVPFKPTRAATTTWSDAGTAVTHFQPAAGDLQGTVSSAAELPADGTRLVFTGTLPAVLTANTVYFVVAGSGTTFKLATTSGGTPILYAGADVTTASFHVVKLNELTRVTASGNKFYGTVALGVSSTYQNYRIDYDVDGVKHFAKFTGVTPGGSWSGGFSVSMVSGATEDVVVVSAPAGNIERLSYSFYPTNETPSSILTYSYKDATAQLEMANKEIAESFCDGQLDAGIYATYAKVLSVNYAPIMSDTETLSDAIYFAQDVFVAADGTTSFQPVGEFAIIYNEAGYNRSLLDMETVSSYPTTSDPIYVEYAGTETTNGTITILAVGNEYTILADRMARTDTSLIIPGIFSPNFISGDIYVEYEAEIRDSQVLNRLNAIDIDAVDESVDGSIYDSIGKPDPRNWLGFATYLVNKIAPNSKFYVMPVTSATTGFQSGLRILSNYRDIKHVGIVNDDFIAALDTWIGSGTDAAGTGENDPNQSRFRLGYCPVAVVDNWYKFGSDSTYESLSGGTFRVPATNANYTFSTSDPTVDFTSSARGVEAGDVFICAERVDANSNPIEYTVKTVYSQTLVFDQQNTTGETPTTVSVAAIKILRELEASEQASRMAVLQTSTNPYVAKIMCGSGIEYTYTNVSTDEDEFMTLGIQFGVIFPFALKISVPPHQPLTFLEFSGYGFGDIINSGSYYDMNDFSKLVSAGYFVMTNDIGTAPFCMRDVTCGISLRAAEIEGVLSKVDPVITYAKDIWYTTRPFIGKYNVTDEVISSIQLKLKSMREYYVSQNYRFLGTLLKTASEPAVTKVANGLRIDYLVSPQDALVEINNYVTVVGN